MKNSQTTAHKKNPIFCILSSDSSNCVVTTADWCNINMQFLLDNCQLDLNLLRTDLFTKQWTGMHAVACEIKGWHDLISRLIHKQQTVQVYTPLSPLPCHAHNHPLVIYPSPHAHPRGYYSWCQGRVGCSTVTTPLKTKTKRNWTRIKGVSTHLLPSFSPH